MVQARFVNFAGESPRNMKPLTFNFSGTLVDLPRPAVMGIVNATPDSFYSGSRAADDEAGKRASKLIQQGADIIDLGAYSTRPGADFVDADTEYDRLARALESIKMHCGNEIPISIDTFRATVADRCIAAFGPLMINDVGGTTLDPEIGHVAAKRHVPYILMHMRGTPQTMASMTDYSDVTAEVIEDLARKADNLLQAGVADIIIDPGFGFAKNTNQNYTLLEALPQFSMMGFPILVGISRKTMIWKPLGITAEEALNGTTVLNTIALTKGADILRVHDVAEAVQARHLCSLLPSAHQ